MKKTFYIFLATGLLAVSQLASAVDSSSFNMGMCPALSTIQNLSFSGVYSAPGKDRWWTRQDGTITYETEHPFGTYSSSYAFFVDGVKAIDGADAIQKVQKALSTAVIQNVSATSLEICGGYLHCCVYPLDFSAFGDEYNGIVPRAYVQL